MKIRTECPKRNNKYYNNKPHGGLSDAVNGSPMIKGLTVLDNCFGGETRYVTAEGLKSFYETVGTTQMVLNENGEFVPAEIKSFGRQKLYKVTFKNGFVVYATENHRWVVDRFSTCKGKRYAKRSIKTTLKLGSGDNIPYNYYDGNGLLDKDGIVHGIVFGDGCKNSNCDTYKVQLFGNKAELKKYLPEHIKSDYNLKEVPSIYESEEYLRGFVAGLIATDGTVTSDTFKITSVDAEALRQIENICYKIGVRTGGIYAETRDVEVGGYEYENHTIYSLTLKRKGIEPLLLKEADRAKIKAECKDIKYTRVSLIEETDRYEEVYCAVEPITHTITLEHSILTGQCVGWANSRFNEIINDPNLEGVIKPFKYQLVCNAENFIESAKRQGLKISPTPVEGGIMVWQKGRTLSGGDGAGHVAVVEEVYDDGTILTSESGWASWTFKNVRRDNSNGRWGQNSAYKFRGCIKNPSIPNPKTVPAPKLIPDGIGGTLTVMAAQTLFGTPADGVYSGQRKDLIKKWCPSLTAVTYGGGGSVGVKAIQRWVGATEDGVWGKATSKALQNALILMGYDVGKYGADGIFGTESMMAFQRFLNEHDTLPPSPKKVDNIVIDVSEMQDKAINWAKVKSFGIKGVIVRCGYRGYETGKLKEDAWFMRHIKGAQAVGLKLGVYFFTEAINYKEGVEEAVFTLNEIQKAGVSLYYPIAVDTEYIGKDKEGIVPRADKLSVEKRTQAIQGFCSEIERQGCRPMIYGSTLWLENRLDMNVLPYDVWCAQYNDKCEYRGKYILWQYTSDGAVSGIKGKVDMNKCYLED